MRNTLNRSIFVVISFAIAMPMARAQSSQSLLVCEGEIESNCDHRHEAFTPCGSINNWAVQACKIQGSPEQPKYQLVPVGSYGGNKCGYGLFKVICVH
jgi:hypothetical protein